jgi:hypothetical protein
VTEEIRLRLVEETRLAAHLETVVVGSTAVPRVEVARLAYATTPEDEELLADAVVGLAEVVRALSAQLDTLPGAGAAEKTLGDLSVLAQVRHARELSTQCAERVRRAEEESARRGFEGLEWKAAASEALEATAGAAKDHKVESL